MAPSGQRRSSYSKRAQYNLFTGYIVAGIGALIGAVLDMLEIRKNNPKLPRQTRVVPMHFVWRESAGGGKPR